MAAKDILVVGELNVDLIMSGMLSVPEIGKEILASDMALTLGSSSAIMASNIAALGVSTSFCGKLGSDYFGDYILGKFQGRGVDTTWITRSPDHKTGATVVMNYDQDRANVTFCGAMEALGLDDIPWGNLHEFRHLHLSNFFIQKKLRSDIVELFKKAKSCGVTTSLDLQWDPAGTWEFDYQACLPYVDIFLPNEAELLALTSSRNIEEALKQIMPHANIIALKLGEKGSVCISGDQRTEVPAFQTAQFVDAIGAGDSFNAGFIHHYLNGATLADCLKYGNLAGALNTTAAGGTGAFADKATLEARMQAMLKNGSK